MLALAKFISSGLTGLGASGLGLYFVPKYFEDNSQSARLIYKAEASPSNHQGIFPFLEREKALLEEWKPILDKFKKALVEIETRKAKEEKEIENSLKQATSKEQELKKLYEEAQKLLGELGKMLQSINKLDEKRLNLESVIHSFDYSNTSLAKVAGALFKWGESLEKIICAIDNKTNCEENAKNWLSTVVNSQAISSPTGGGSQASTAAVQQLKESREEILKKQRAIRVMLELVKGQNFAGLYQEAFHRKQEELLKNHLEDLNNFSKAWSEKHLKEKIEEGNKKTKELNELYQKLEEANTKWRRLKKNGSIIHQYKGQIQNFLCINVHNQNSKECEPQLQAQNQ